MLISFFGPRGGTLATLSILFFLTLCLYLLEKKPFRRAPPHPPKPTLKYRPTPISNPPVVENFPHAAKATSRTDLPPIPSFNRVKGGNFQGTAPLLIAFTRNWPILQQAVISYLAAGWPADQVYVIENTGTMDSNKAGHLSLQNPFYLDHGRLTKVFGINVVSTPTLFSFAQLQNFMIHLAIENSWSSYFWSHMDVVALSDERFTVADKDDSSTGRYANLFQRAVAKRDELDDWQKAGVTNGPEEFKDTNGKWALHYFAYDRLTLVNLESYVEVGGWDPMIGYYLGDCDFYERLRMGRYRLSNGEVGLIADVGSTLDDLGVFYRRIGWPNSSALAGISPVTSVTKHEEFGVEDERGGAGYDALHDAIISLQEYKLEGGPGLRNFWQSQQQGGSGEPFYKDPEGFERGLWMMIESGRQIYAEKWGHRDCDLLDQTLQPSDAWRVEHDWD